MALCPTEDVYPQNNGGGEESLDSSYAAQPKTSNPPISYSRGLAYCAKYSRCMVRWGEDNTFYLSRIDSIDGDTYTVTFLQYGTTANTVQTSDIVPFIPPSVDILTPGQVVFALSEDDALFHEAVIEYTYRVQDFDVAKVRYVHSNKYADLDPFDVYLPDSYLSVKDTTTLSLPALAASTPLVAATNSLPASTDTAKDAHASQTAASTDVSVRASAAPARVGRVSRWDTAGSSTPSTVPTTNSGAPSSAPSVTTDAFATLSTAPVPEPSMLASAPSGASARGSAIPAHLQLCTDPQTLEFVVPARFMPTLADTAAQRQEKQTKVSRMRRQWHEWREAERVQQRAAQWKQFQSAADVRFTATRPPPATHASTSTHAAPSSAHTVSIVSRPPVHGQSAPAGGEVLSFAARAAMKRKSGVAGARAATKHGRFF